MFRRPPGAFIFESSQLHTRAPNPIVNPQNVIDLDWRHYCVAVKIFFF